MLKLELNPIDEHIDQIEKWLIEDWNKNKEGFLKHWDMIQEAYAENRLSVLLDNGIAIGFVVYRIFNELGLIDIAEIKPSNRKKGIARKFILNNLKFFKSKGVLVVKLFCAPEISEGFWKKCGFNKFKIPNSSRINMYKTLIPILEPSGKMQNNDILKLWDCEPYQANENEPKWLWNLEYKPGNKTLIKPIIFPAYKDWQLGLMKNEEQIEKKVKYFPMNFSYDGTFMIIREVSE